jgi:Fur family ferric uptake transcriptional regulator
MERKVFKNFLKERGQKLTKEREAILKEIFSFHGHFEPETRTLNLLYECGLIDRVRKTEHGTIYECTYGHEHHDHMLCVRCGKIIEFYSEDLERLQEELCKKQQFEGTNHTLEIRGYCKKCQKKKE